VTRLAIVFPGGEQRGGAEALLMHFLSHSKASLPENVVLIFQTSGPMPESARAMGYDVRVFETKRLRNGFDYIAIVMRLYRLFRREKIEVVLSWMSKSHLYAGPAAWFANITAIWYQHGISGGSKLDQIATVIPAKLVLCCSTAAATAQQALFFKRKTRVVYPAVDISYIQRSANQKVSERNRLGLGKDKFIVLMIARQERWKGIDIFLQAAQSFAMSGKETTFVHLGGPHIYDLAYSKRIQETVRDLGLGDHLKMIGQVPMEEVASWLASADAYVHPAIGPEPFGMVLVEAMAAGLPVVASKIGGISEIIEQDVNGILIPPNDADSLIKAINELMFDKKLCARLGQNALSRAEDFSLDKFSAEIISVVFG